MSGTLQTEFEFTLPQGYVDDQGTLHKEGRMRLATASDEIEPLSDPRVQQNSSYLTIVLLSRVITQLGELDNVDNYVIEDLFVGDLEYLQALYERINNRGANAVSTSCPECGEQFDVSAETGAVTESSPLDTAGGAGQAGVDVDLPGMEEVAGNPMEMSDAGPGQAPEGEGDTGNSMDR